VSPHRRPSVVVAVNALSTAPLPPPLPSDAPARAAEGPWPLLPAPPNPPSPSPSSPPRVGIRLSPCVGRRCLDALQNIYQLKLKNLVSGFYKIRHYVAESNKSTDFYVSIVLPPIETKFELIPCQVIPNRGSTKYWLCCTYLCALRYALLFLTCVTWYVRGTMRIALCRWFRMHKIVVSQSIRVQV